MDIYILVFIGIVGLNIIFLGLVIYWYRNKMLSQYNNFLNKADEILGGKQIDMIYDESLDSAISERLNRIVEISNMQKEVAEQERNTIKSLLSNISHQIRTPLANITLYACYYVFTNFNIYGIPFVFPVIKTLLLFIAIIIVCVVTSLFVFSKSKSETIIELLRKDEA